MVFLPIEDDNVARTTGEGEMRKRMTKRLRSTRGWVRPTRFAFWARGNHGPTQEEHDQIHNCLELLVLRC